jgi:hypothetical protein
MRHHRSALAVAALAAAALTAPAHATTVGTSGLPTGGISTSKNDGEYHVTGSCSYTIDAAQQSNFSGGATATGPGGSNAQHIDLYCDYYYTTGPYGIHAGPSNTNNASVTSQQGWLGSPTSVCVNVIATWSAKTLSAWNCSNGATIYLDGPLGNVQVGLDHPLVAEGGNVPGHLHECTAAPCTAYAAELAQDATGKPVVHGSVDAGGQHVDVDTPVCVGETVEVCVP